MIIFTLKKDQFTLQHSRFNGVRDFFEIIEDKPDGKLLHIPFLPPIKMSDYKRSDPISLTTEYTPEEYQAMLDNQIEQIEKHNNDEVPKPI